MATETTLEDLYSFDEVNGTIDAADLTTVEEKVKAGVADSLGVEGNIETSTPVGRMIEWLSLYFTRVLGLNVQNANQLLVSAAAGQQLDAMAQWFQLKRRGASYSQVTVTCSGTAGTAIPAGSTVRSTNGDIFESVSAATIGSNGFVDVRFEALEKGAIPVAAGTVNIVDTVITGWDSCNNESTGQVGDSLEPDESLRKRIQDSRTVAPGFLGAIKNAVEKVVGTGAAMVLENNTNAKLDVHGVEMVQHSILVCVDGLVSPKEDDNYADYEKVKAVAKAIFDNKPCGTGYTKVTDSKSFLPNEDGTDSTLEPSDYQYDVPVIDAFGNEYHVFFAAPVPQPVSVFLQVKNRSYTGANLSRDVTEAIKAWRDTANFKCGEDVYATDVIRAVESKVPGVIVVSCTVSDSDDGEDKGTAVALIDAIHKAKIDDDNIKVSLFSR